MEPSIRHLVDQAVATSSPCKRLCLNAPHWSSYGPAVAEMYLALAICVFS